MADVGERTEVVARHLCGVVKRSMCDAHFENFDTFRDGTNEVCRIAARAEIDFQESLLNFFPQAPQGISRETWIWFDGWVWGVGGVALQTLCFEWSFYGQYTLRVCELCERRVNPPAIVEIAPDVDSSENDESGTESEEGDADDEEDEDYEMDADEEMSESDEIESDETESEDGNEDDNIATNEESSDDDVVFLGEAIPPLAATLISYQGTLLL